MNVYVGPHSIFSGPRIFLIKSVFRFEYALDKFYRNFYTFLWKSRSESEYEATKLSTRLHKISHDVKPILRLHSMTPLEVENLE
jgi:hypothetical protein